MFSIERLRTELGSLPLLVKAGLVVMALAGLADVAAHLEASDHVGHLHEHATTELWAHLGGFIGMVLVFTGVVVDGIRQQRLRRPESISKGVA